MVICDDNGLVDALELRSGDVDDPAILLNPSMCLPARVDPRSVVPDTQAPILQVLTEHLSGVTTHATGKTYEVLRLEPTLCHRRGNGVA